MTSILVILKVGALTAIFLFVPCVLCNQKTRSKIAADLLKEFHLDDDARTNIVLKFKGKPAKVLERFSLTARSSEVDVNEMHKSYIRELKEMRDFNQAEVLDFLDKPSVLDSNMQHSSCWMTNEVFVKKANRALVKQLAKFENVESIQKEIIFRIHDPLEEGPVVDQSRIVAQNNGNNSVKATGPEWNIQKINVEEAHQSFNTRGEGVTVGIIDTGINSKHEGFQPGQVSKFKDAVNGKTDPYDDNGHGTHCAGTIAGHTGTGVAPGVTLYCCKACSGDGACAQSDLTGCGEYMHEQKPHIVSNSWGGPSDSTWFDHVINSWEIAGIIAVFSAGNSGPSCFSVGSPADNSKVISVAATTKDDALADFSSRGKCASGENCPLVSAPGHKIESCWSSSNTAYKTISGTSMAAPHVSGLLALMTAKNKMTPAQAKNAIISSCVTSGLADPQQTCGGSTFDKFPNNMYGNGRIDCMKALQAMTSDTKENSGSVGKEDGVENKEKKESSSNSTLKNTRLKHAKIIFTTNV